MQSADIVTATMALSMLGKEFVIRMPTKPYNNLIKSLFP